MANTLTLNQELLINIKRIGINGEGIGYYKRLAIFVDGVLPGENVVVRISELYDTYAKAVFVRFKNEPSPDRVRPICPNYTKCGGCQLMHMNYEAQLATKKNLVVEAFDRYFNGTLNEKVFKDTIGADDPWCYRNKVKRPVRYDGEKLVTGLYEAGSNRLIYIDKCHVEDKYITNAMKEICEYLSKYQVIAYNPRLREGILRDIVIRISEKTKDMQVTLILYKKDERTLKIAKGLLTINKVVSVYYSVNSDLEGIENFGEKTTYLIGEETIFDDLDGLRFEILPNAFFQLNHAQTEKLYKEAIRLGHFKGYENVIDAYCGVGTIGLYASKYVTEVRGIDINKEGIINAKKNAEINNIKNAKFYSGNILPHLHDFEKKGFVADVLIVDPPRTGLDINFIRYLQQHPVKKIIYISCNPSTLAKNCNHLNNKYHILVVQPLDMFPQTSAVETICILERR